MFLDIVKGFNSGNAGSDFNFKGPTAFCIMNRCAPVKWKAIVDFNLKSYLHCKTI